MKAAYTCSSRPHTIGAEGLIYLRRGTSCNESCPSNKNLRHHPAVPRPNSASACTRSNSTASSACAYYYIRQHMSPGVRLPALAPAAPPPAPAYTHTHTHTHTYKAPAYIFIYITPAPAYISIYTPAHAPNSCNQYANTTTLAIGHPAHELSRIDSGYLCS